MINPLVGHVTLGIYAALLAVGGIMGFVKARSTPSLISGVASALAALAALGLSATRNPIGVPLGATLAIVLFVFFGYRYALRNRTFLPNGLMALVSLAVLLVMILVMDWSALQSPAVRA